MEAATSPICVNVIEPILIARDTDYAGFINEIEQTGIEIA
jgi:hypothetical protein